MITCQACGTQNPAGAAFCSKCARKLDPETQQAVVLERRQYAAARGINWSSVLVALVAIILLIAIALFVVVHGI